MATEQLDHVAARVEHNAHEDTEDEDESEGDYKEPREEELSLIAHSDSGDMPVPIIRTPHSRHKQYSSGSKRVLQKNVHSCSEIDIQIATADTSREERRFSLEMPQLSSSSMKTLCGPHPSKIALICLLVISVWTMLVLVIHLDKKLSLTSETLAQTQDKIKMIQDTALSTSHDNKQQMKAIDRKLERLWKLLKSDQKLPHTTPPSSTTQSPTPDTTSVDPDNFFSDGDSDNWK